MNKLELKQLIKEEVRIALQEDSNEERLAKLKQSDPKIFQIIDAVRAADKIPESEIDYIGERDYIAYNAVLNIVRVKRIETPYDD
jgi:hypothetical protein